MNNEEALARLADYGVETTNAKKLDGYESENFLIESKGSRFVFKHYGPNTIEKEVIEAESLLLARLSECPLLNVPGPIRIADGEYVGGMAEKGFDRLLTFVDGEFIANGDVGPELRESFGKFIATLSEEMNKEVPFAYRGRSISWDLANYALCRKFLPFIEDPVRRSWVEYFFLQADEKLSEVELRPGLIHGDAHEGNVLRSGSEVTGIIDFGDASYSWLVNDLAIACSYLMCEQENPLTAATDFIRGYCSRGGLTEDEISVLYYLIALRMCISVCHSAEAKNRRPDDPYLTNSEKPAWDLIERFFQINPLNAEKKFREAAGFDSLSPYDHSDDLKRRHSTTSNALSITFSTPLKMRGAAFQYMYAEDGKAYLDCYNNIPQVGHCHPRVVEAATKAMASLNTNTRYLNENYLSYAENLLSKFPKHLNKVFFVNSGSAANDLALRLAAACTSNSDVVVVEHGYHGNTRSGIDISHYKYNRKGGSGRTDGIHEATIPDIYKGKYRGTDAGLSFAQDSLKELPVDGISAFIAEPVVGCGGQVPLPQGYLSEMYAGIRSKGGICISDEVQTGFGRLGNWFWGFEMHDVEPDIVVMGKPMGNGHPMAAVVTTDEIASAFETGMEFFSSFGGNTVSCAIGQAVLDVLESEELPARASDVGSYLLSGLKELVEKHDVAGDARGEGLFLGLELVKDGNPNSPATDIASIVKEGLKDNGVLVGIDGPDENVVKIKPPICFDRKNADFLVELLDKQLLNL